MDVGGDRGGDMTAQTRGTISRRTLAKGVAWAAPTAVMAVAAPAYAASCVYSISTFTNGVRGTYKGGTGSNGYASWRPDGSATRKYWVVLDNAATGTDTVENYVTTTRYATIRNTGNVAITVNAALTTNFGNDCSTCAQGAGLIVQASVDNGATWTTVAHIVTRTGMAGTATPSSLPIVSNTGANTTLGAVSITGSAATTVAPDNTCSGGAYKNSTVTASIPAATTALVREVFYAAPRTSNSTCTSGQGPWGNDDIGIEDFTSPSCAGA